MDLSGSLRGPTDSPKVQEKLTTQTGFIELHEQDHDVTIEQDMFTMQEMLHPFR
jgi:hypothetical protein